MTAYSVTGVGYGGSVCILANAYEIRFTSASVWSNSGTAYTLSLIRQVGSTMTGGSALTISPLRDGSPLASATARVGNVTTSGVGYIIQSFPLATGTASSDLYYSTSAPAQAQAQIPLPVTVAPGNVLNLGIGDAYCGFSLVFEELRLQGSY